MKNYEQILDQLLGEKIIAILRVKQFENAKQGVAALKKGGIKNIEVTLNTPGAMNVISVFSNDDEINIGAGTVLDGMACQQAIQNGADYIVTPTLNESVIKCCNRYHKPIICGCYTPSEMQKALELGADMIKAFPASELSYSFIKAVKAPLPQLIIGPTGGVSLANINNWEKAGADFYGIAGEFSKLADQGKYEELEKTAKKYIDAITER